MPLLSDYSGTHLTVFFMNANSSNRGHKSIEGSKRQNALANTDKKTIYTSNLSIKTPLPIRSFFAQRVTKPRVLDTFNHK